MRRDTLSRRTLLQLTTGVALSAPIARIPSEAVASITGQLGTGPAE